MQRFSTLEEAIFWQVYFRPCCRRSELAESMHVSAPSVSRSISLLLEKKLVVERPCTNQPTGRKPTLLCVNPTLATLLGLEIDRERMTAVVTDLAGNLLGRGAVSWNADERVEDLLPRSRAAIQEALDDAEVSARQIRRLGVGHPGYLDPEEGRCVFWANVGGWRNVPLRQMLHEEFGLDVTLDDRSRALALAERRSTPGDGQHPNALYVHAGNGIGAAIFFDGRLFSPPHRAAAEIGHVVIDADGPACSCGNRGCVEVFASLGAVLRDVKAALDAGEHSLLAAMRRRRGCLTIEMVAAAANRGDRLAAKVLDRAAHALGLGIGNAVQLMNPSLIVLSGKLANAAGQRLLDGVMSAVCKQFGGALGERLQIRLARPKKDICAVGCALLGADAEAEMFVREMLFSEHFEHPHLAFRA